MPIYAYTCPNAHAHTERRPFGDHAQTCPRCGEPVRQVFGVPLVVYRSFGQRPYSPDDAARGETMKEEICVSE